MSLSTSLDLEFCSLILGRVRSRLESIFKNSWCESEVNSRNFVRRSYFETFANNFKVFEFSPLQIRGLKTQACARTRYCGRAAKFPASDDVHVFFIRNQFISNLKFKKPLELRRKELRNFRKIAHSIDNIVCLKTVFFHRELMGAGVTPSRVSENILFQNRI